MKTHLGHYEIVAELGRGGMGVVYKGFEPALNRFVAIKELSINGQVMPDEVENIVARFQREAQAASKLQHPNIVSVYEYLIEGDRHYMVMEFLEGKSLQHYIDLRQAFNFEQTVDIGAQVCAALDYARNAGLGFAQLAALNAWRGGSAAPYAVPAEAAGLVVAMLESLARLERFDEFEALAGVVDKLDLPWREQRELLAGVYLRRGFGESAAREWIGVAEKLGAPDERVLLGLATLAEAQGLHEDAEIMRAEARQLAQAAA